MLPEDGKHGLEACEDGKDSIIQMLMLLKFWVSSARTSLLAFQSSILELLVVPTWKKYAQ